MPPPLPPIYVISLARAESRRDNIKHRLNALGASYEIVDAVDGKTADPAIYQSRLRQDIARRKKGRELLPGEIGCHLSHYHLWQRIVAEQIPQAIVLEDDAAPNADFCAVIADILSLNVPWDVINLAADSKRRTDAMLRGLAGKDYVFGRYQEKLLRTHAYLISLAGAKKVLDICREIAEPIDRAWGYWWQTGLLFYCVAPPLAQQTEKESFISGIRGKPATLKEKIIASMYRRKHRIKCKIARIRQPLPTITRAEKGAQQ